MKNFLATFAVATVLLLAGSGRAEEATTPPCQTATECTTQGDEAYLAGRYAEAEPFFREALRIEPENIYYILSLAQTLEGIGDCPYLQEAQELYSQINSGEGTVSANAQGGLDRIAEAVTACEETPPPPPATEEEPPPEIPPAETTTHNRSGEVAAWAIFGVGVATLATGLVLYVPAWLAADERDSFCSEGVCLDVGEQRLWGVADESFQRFALAGDILVGVGAAVAVGGLIWALVARHRHREETPVVVSFLPSGNGLVFTLRR